MQALALGWEGVVHVTIFQVAWGLFLFTSYEDLFFPFISYEDQ